MLRAPASAERAGRAFDVCRSARRAPSAAERAARSWRRRPARRAWCRRAAPLFSSSGVPHLDPAGVDDREPVGELVGLVEVVGGEQHGHPRRRRRAGRSRPTSRPAPRGPARSSARRGRAPPAGGPVRSRRRACGSCRRTRSSPDGRRRRRSRTAEQLGGPGAGVGPDRPWIRAARTRFSRPVAIGSEDGLCETSRSAGAPRPGACRRRCPATTAVPASARARVDRILTVVDLPAPLGPSSPNTVPRSASKLRSSSAWTEADLPPRYALRRPTAEMGWDMVVLLLVKEPARRLRVCLEQVCGSTLGWPPPGVPAPAGVSLVVRSGVRCPRPGRRRPLPPRPGVARGRA